MTGNAADFLIGPEAEVSAEEYEQLKANLGLDKPLPVQYALFLGQIVRLDFGESIIMGRSARGRASRAISSNVGTRGGQPSY